jgi:VWFA-related protein
MLQGFSRDPNALVAVAEKLHPDSSLLLTTEGERQNVIGFETYRAIMAAPDGMADSQLQRVKQQYNDQEDARTKQRLLFTLDALKAMARAVSGYPGRKSLIWLSGSFPIRLEPNQAAMDPFRNSADYMMELARATALLSESRVAVYPIDVRGILTSGMDVSVPSSYGSMAYTGGKQQIANGSNDQASGLLHEQFTSRSNEHEAMTEAAYQTGGRAFLTNDFADAMKKAMNDGSTFYTIAYTPPEQKDKSEPYHHIEVKLSRPDTNLSYRRGYYSTPQKMTAAEGTAALQGALQPGMPPATMLYVMASVQPPTGKQKTVKINYIISPSNVTFSDLPENKKHVVVDCMVVAFDKDGKEVAHASDTLDGAIPQAAYDAVMKQGLPANQEIELKPGTYNLRLGVMDHATQQIGTVDVPLEITDGSLGK